MFGQGSIKWYQRKSPPNKVCAVSTWRILARVSLPFVFVLRQGFLNPRLASNEIWFLGWPWTSDHPVSPTSPVAGSWGSNRLCMPRQALYWELQPRPLLTALKHSNVIVPVLSKSPGERTRVHANQILTWSPSFLWESCSLLAQINFSSLSFYHMLFLFNIYHVWQGKKIRD